MEGVECGGKEVQEFRHAEGVCAPRRACVCMGDGGERGVEVDGGGVDVEERI